jgi:hypothetical protein
MRGNGSHRSLRDPADDATLYFNSTTIRIIPGLRAPRRPLEHYIDLFSAANPRQSVQFRRRSCRQSEELR